MNASVNETSSIAANTGVDGAQPVWSGTFQSLAYPTNGNAAAYATSDGTHTVRFTNFRTSNGPDVRVYGVAGTDVTSDDAIQRGEFVDLGALKGNVGDQNYGVPAEVDLTRYHSISSWCRCRSVTFGATGTSAATAAHTAAFATGEYVTQVATYRGVHEAVLELWCLFHHFRRQLHGRPNYSSVLRVC